MSNAKMNANLVKVGESDKRRTNTVDMVRTYLQEIGKVPLLSHEQEILFGKQVQQMMAMYKLKEELTKELGRNQPWKNGQKRPIKPPRSCRKSCIRAKGQNRR